MGGQDCMYFSPREAHPDSLPMLCAVEVGLPDLLTVSSYVFGFLIFLIMNQQLKNKSPKEHLFNSLEFLLQHLLIKNGKKVVIGSILVM